MDFKELCSRVLPIPRKVTPLESTPLFLPQGSKIALSVPAAEAGPAKTAVTDLTAWLTCHCGEDCFSPNGFPVVLALDETPAEVDANAEEGYCLTVTAGGITVAGFGEKGLLYGVLTLTQLARWENGRLSLPALEILDWPENSYRGLFIESRYGSNIMEKDEWFAMIDDLASKKLNVANICLYGCWSIQYDDRVSEYMYIPLRKYPQLKTPMTVRYFDPRKNEWVDYETLPPIFRDDLLGQIIAYGKEKGVTVIPLWNSLGHNTLLPAQLPQTSAKTESGEPTLYGFCTNDEATYEVLFNIYDQIIDEYLIPNGIDIFHIGLDEVQDGRGRNVADLKDLDKVRSPWCKCPKCRDKSKGELFIAHTVRLIRHLKDRGMKTVMMYWDMLLPGPRAYTENILEDFIAAAKEADILDVLMLDWWTYLGTKEALDFDSMHPELNIRSVAKPWNGYYIWDLLTNAMPNVQLLAEMNHRDKGLGIIAYATWDRSYDLTHDAIADYAWDCEQAGSPEKITDRYVRRNFAPLYDRVRHAYRLVFDWILESRPWTTEDPQRRILSNSSLMLTHLMYYHHYAGVKAGKPHPRNFLGEALERILPIRHDVERSLYTISALCLEAIAIFNEAAADPRCNQAIAKRMAYECDNYLCVCRDWMAILRMYDLCNAGNDKAVAPIARARQEARKALIAHAMDAKEHCTTASLTLRNHSIFMQQFGDIADYVESTDKPQLDLLNIQLILTERSHKLR